MAEVRLRTTSFAASDTSRTVLKSCISRCSRNRYGELTGEPDLRAYTIQGRPVVKVTDGKGVLNAATKANISLLPTPQTSETDSLGHNGHIQRIQPKYLRNKGKEKIVSGKTSLE